MDMLIDLIDFLTPRGRDSLLNKYVLSGGPLMWVLVPCSLLAMGSILQCAIRLRRSRVMGGALNRQARQARTDRQRQEFIEKLSGKANPLARCSWLTFKNFNPAGGHPPRYALEARLDEAAAEVAVEMQDGLGMLATLYTVAPLLGLLGTIHGMIMTFYKFGVQGDKSVESLAVGIQYALVTTLWGLSIAIPVYVAAQWLQGRIHRYERRLLPDAVRDMADALWAENGGEPAAGDASRAKDAARGEPALEAAASPTGDEA
ncbi:MAG: MotA/TolQ/ExbB proton channel family protein [bacterium]|nr:MotA/TolQ/ExbB proton channel family protein [bacterium]